jgi:hypothetical protein
VTGRCRTVELLGQGRYFQNTTHPPLVILCVGGSVLLINLKSIKMKVDFSKIAKIKITDLAFNTSVSFLWHSISVQGDTVEIKKNSQKPTEISSDAVKTKADELIQQMFSFIPTQESVELMLLASKYCAIQSVKEFVFEYQVSNPNNYERLKFWQDVEAELRSR